MCGSSSYYRYHYGRAALLVALVTIVCVLHAAPVKGLTCDSSVILITGFQVTEVGYDVKTRTSELEVKLNAEAYVDNGTTLNITVKNLANGNQLASKTCQTTGCITCVMDQTKSFTAQTRTVEFEVHATVTSFSTFLQASDTTTVTFQMPYEPDLSELGPPPCERAVGDPVDATTGNMYQARIDVAFGSDFDLPLVFSRSYNSQADNSGGSGILGAKWTHSFDWFVNEVDTGHIILREATGRVLEFDGDGPVGLKNQYNILKDTVTDIYTVTTIDNMRYVFNADGTLSSISHRDQSTIDLTYNDTTGLLSRVTDPSGRYIKMEYTANGHLDHIEDSNDTTLVSYFYETLVDTVQLNPLDTDTAWVLDSVAYPDGTWETYDSQEIERSWGTSLGAITRIYNSDSVGRNFDYWLDGRIQRYYMDDSTNRIFMYYDIDSVETFPTMPPSKISIVSYTEEPLDDTTTRTYRAEYLGGRRVLEVLQDAGCSSCGSAFTYNTDGYRYLTTYPNLLRMRSFLDSAGRAWRFERADGSEFERISEYVYKDSDFNLLDTFETSSIGRSGKDHVFDASYDTHGNVTRIDESGWYNSADSFSTTTSLAYNDEGQVDGIDGPLPGSSDLTTILYHDNGDLDSIYLANGDTYVLGERDARGNRTTIKDPNGIVTKFMWNIRNRLDSVIENYGGPSRTTRFEWDYEGNLTKVTTPEGNSVRYVFDNHNNLTDIIDDYDDRVHLSYDSLSRVIREQIVDQVIEIDIDTMTDTIIDTLTYDTTYSTTYDTLYDTLYDTTLTLSYRYTGNGRLDRVTFPDSSYVEASYDAMGSVEQVFDANGNRTDYDYDLLNRVETATRFLGNEQLVTEFEYDDNDNVTKVIDPDGNEFEYEYSDRNQLVYESSDAAGGTTYKYDNAGSLKEVSTARGNTLEFEYDALGRLEEERGADSLNLYYDYDGTEFANGKGKLYKETNSTCETKYEYDAFGRIVKEYRTYPPDTSQFITSYTYDQDDNLTVIVYPSGIKVLYLYDDRSNCTSVSWQAVNDTEWRILADSIEYVPFGPEKSWYLGNGISMTNTFNERYAIDTIGSSLSGLVNLAYSFDSHGNITEIENLDSLYKTVSFVYDSLNQLRSATCSGFPDSTRTFVYHDNGNRSKMYTDVGVDLDSVLYTYTNNRLTGISNPSTVYTCDAEGNLDSVIEATDTVVYGYSAGGNLTSVTNGLLTTTLSYDGLSRRVRKATGGQVRNFFYSPGGLLLSEYRGEAWDVDYVYLNGRPLAKIQPHSDPIPPGPLGPITMGIILPPPDSLPDPPPPPAVPNYDVFWYHNDHLGTPLALTDSSQTVCWRGDYYPFGELYAQTVSTENYFRFPGQYEDGESDLHHNWFRYYDPSLGRYTQIDPLASNHPSLTPYNYVGNNPLRYADPMGLDWYNMSYGTDPDIQWVDGSDVQVKPGIWNNIKSWFGRGETATSMGSELLVGIGSLNETPNSAAFLLYSSSYTGGPSGAIMGNTMPSDPSRWATIAPGIYPASRTDHRRDRNGNPRPELLISPGECVPTVWPNPYQGSPGNENPNYGLKQADEILFHRGNISRPSLFWRDGETPISMGCPTALHGGGAGRAQYYMYFMGKFPRDWRGNFYLVRR